MTCLLHFNFAVLKNINSVIFSCLLAASLNGIAQEKDSLQLDEVIITGSRVQSKAQHLPSTISLISQKRIENSGQMNIMPILSGYVPGLFVTERGVAGYGVASGSAGAITIRGVGSAAGKAGDPLTNTQVLFLIDGHPQFMGLMGHHLSDSYMSENVERIEVIRGPASVLYGSNAMGGVVNIITKSQKKDGIFATFKPTYGSYNTQRYPASAMIKSGKWDGVISLEYAQTDGERKNSQFFTKNGFAKIGYTFSDHLKATADFGLNKYKAYDPDTINAPNNSLKWADVSRGVFSATLENKFTYSSGSVIVYKNFGEHRIYDGYHSTDNLQGINIFQSLTILKGNVLIAGLDYNKYGGFAENLTLNDFTKNLMKLPADRTINEKAVYLTMQQNVLEEKLFLNAGMRYELNSVYGDQWIPQAGISFIPNQYTILKGSIAKGFRNPTVKELYMFPPHNENLGPERMINYELSWLQKWLNGNLTTELTGFIAEGSNLITIDNMKYVNTGSFLNKGFELVLNYNLSKKLSFMANYSFLHMNKTVLAAPKHQVFYTALYTPLKKLKFNLSIQNIQRLIIQASPVLTENYTLVNLQTTYKLFPSMEMYSSFNNLLNQRYQINKGYPMPPINIFVGLKFLIGG